MCCIFFFFFFFKQKTEYQMRISDWSSDVCSSDLFPHHENEIAQSEGASGHTFVNYWMHNGFVRVDNEKMSKSLGNFFTIREVLAKFDAEVVRFFILRAHYRSQLNYSDAHQIGRASCRESVCQYV